jgi:hypothetical protein
MNWKGFGTKRSWSNIKVLSRNSPGESEENHEKTQDRIAAAKAWGSYAFPGSVQVNAGTVTFKQSTTLSFQYRTYSSLPHLNQEDGKHAKLSRVLY